MDLLQLTYFKEIAELENISKASAKLMVAQPALSKVIKNLETELDIKLFDRIGKSIHLNDNGKILLKHTTEILRHLDDAKTELREQNGKLGGSVTISFQAATRLIPKILLGFKQEYPEIRVIIKMSENINEADCDLFIYSSGEKINAPNNIPLLKEPCCIALSKKHNLAFKKVLDMKDLSDEDFIILQAKQSLYELTTKCCLKAGFSPKITLECDQDAAIFTLIENNMGVSFIPQYTWDVKSNNMICYKPINGMECFRYINLKYRDSGYVSKAALLFSDYLKDFFEQLNSGIKSYSALL